MNVSEPEKITLTAEEKLSVLLLTQNIAGLFDDIPTFGPAWIQGVAALVQRKDADFLAIRMQEVGGSAYKKQGVSSAAQLAQLISAAFAAEFWCSGLFLNADVEKDFSALGSIFLVRKAKKAFVRVWKFGEEGGGGSGGEWTAIADEPIASDPAGFALPTSHCRHARFADSTFPIIANWSRKGYLHTRWKVGAAPLELINVHLFHEDSNLTALQRAADLPGFSVYLCTSRV